ncbi:MAG: hypothetical protein R2780_09015 [Crocinitomicaceae bacterium]|nr:hypothetical protein [Crocinitomicaceae bacterium]
MKNTLITLLLVSFYLTSNAQEFESDLFLTLKSSTVHQFWKSEKKTLTVTTYRNSTNEGVVEESETSYKKGKINPNRINYNIKYTEYFVLEDRKKSLGKYEFNENNELFKYERTDFDNRNQRTYTFYHTFYYESAIVSRENIKTKEYVGQGSVELDTIVYLDSVIYKVAAEGANYRQDNLSDPGVYAIYELQNEEVITKTNYFEGFHEIVKYHYDSKGLLVKVENILVGEDGNSITTYTDILYTIDGLVTETKFYDEKDKLLERKVFTYS